MLGLVVDPFEIILNLFQDSLGFAFSKTLGQPFAWVTITFMVIAPAYAMASGYDIVLGISSASRLRQKMILSQMTPETRWLTTVCATAVKIIQGLLPIGRGKTVRQATFSGTAVPVECEHLIGMRLPVASGFFVDSLRMRSAPLLRTGVVLHFMGQIGTALLRLGFLWIGMIPAASAGSLLFGMGFTPAVLRLACALWMASAVLAMIFAIALKVLLVVATFQCAHMLWILRAPLAGAFSATGAAPGVQSIFRVLMGQEIAFSRQKPSVTMRAAFKREGEIQHGNLSSSQLGVERGAEPRNSVVGWFMTPSQAHRYYITSRGV